MTVRGWRGKERGPVDRIVADTNLFVAAAFNPASDAARVLAAVRAGTLRLVWDDPARRKLGPSSAASRPWPGPTRPAAGS